MNPLTQEPMLDENGVQIVDENGISLTITREMTLGETKDYQNLQAAQAQIVKTEQDFVTLVDSALAKLSSPTYIPLTIEEAAALKLRQ